MCRSEARHHNANGRTVLAATRGSIGAVSVSYRGELFKLLAQRRTWLGFVTVVIGPIVYLVLVLAQGPPQGPVANNLGHTRRSRSWWSS